MPKTIKEGKWKETFRDDFAGGVNVYLGVRQVDDNESPESTNCDFKGLGGVGNRGGYTEIDSVTDSRTDVQGLATLNTTSVNQLIKFADDGADVELYYSTDDGAWAEEAGTTWTTDTRVHSCQAMDNVYMVNGNNEVMREWDGAAISTTTDGSKGTFPVAYAGRLWVIDPAIPYRLKFSGQYSNASEEGGGTTSKFAQFTYDAGTNPGAGSLDFEKGAGKDIIGIITFQNQLYVFLTDAIYRLYPGDAVNTFIIQLVTNAVGCTSGYSLAQVEEDVFFAADDGIYSLGDVANYTAVRTTNKSRKIQTAFDGISPANKKLIVGKYFNFKYHMFYSLYGTENDSCFVYDIRYKGWQDWRNMAANDATLYKQSTGERGIYFGKGTTGEVFRLYDNATTDNGSVITSTWYSKSFDEGLSSIMKLYFDSTFTFGELNGDVTVSTIFDDGEVSATKTISQVRPQGGFGRNAYGRTAYGVTLNTAGTLTDYRGKPLRLKAKDKKFAIQYKITSSDHWRLDSISQMYSPFGHFKYESIYKLN